MSEGGREAEGEGERELSHDGFINDMGVVYTYREYGEKGEGETPISRKMQERNARGKRSLHTRMPHMEITHN